MKNLSVFIILMVPFLFSCQDDIKDLRSESRPTNLSPTEQMFVSGTLGLVQDFNKEGRSNKYIISPTYADKHDSRLGSMLKSKLYKNRYKVDWQTLDGMVQEFLEEHNIDPFVFSDKYKSGLQFAAYTTAHRSGLSAPQSPERDSMLVKYMHILMAQKGHDCQDSAELLRAVENSLKPSVFKNYKEILFEVSKVEKRQAEGNIKELNQNLNAESTLTTKYKLKNEIDRYLGAEEAIKLLSVNGNGSS